MILTAVDFRFNAHEDKVIREYLVSEFPFAVNLDREMEIISRLLPGEWEAHYITAMDDFYDDATPEERLKLIDFAIKITKADDIITKEENKFLNLLFDAWDHESV